jgi:malonyl-CoA O-methyltransferase
MGWGDPSHAFTDMHDWGDMLVQAGFAEPVMDMERVTLTWTSPELMLEELRTLGINLHPGRFPACRGRHWHERLLATLRERLAGPDGRLALVFEIVYGHAMRPPARPRVAAESSLSLQDMRQLLRGDRSEGTAP